MSSIEEMKHLQIPYQDISPDTNGFAEENLIAKGGFGKVYKGKYEKLGIIVVKQLDRELGQGDREFVTEIALLSSYKHKNIVSLHGFCDKNGKKILVYKYESKGSPDNHLKSKDQTWIQCLQICLDAACGLKYLHDDVGPQHRIIHPDLKSANILLDENWKAKISDFGLSKISPANVEFTFLISTPTGTIGYVDPEYATTSMLIKESDVFSSGAVLCDVWCGRPAWFKGESTLLYILAQKHYERETLDEIIQFDLQKQINAASLRTFTTIAYQLFIRFKSLNPYA